MVNSQVYQVLKCGQICIPLLVNIFIRNRLRYCIWYDWKKLERKPNSIRHTNGQAYTWSRTRKGGWAVAQSPILKTTITKSRIR
jgi:hypothetical protein